MRGRNTTPQGRGFVVSGVEKKIFVEEENREDHDHGQKKKERKKEDKRKERGKKQESMIPQHSTRLSCGLESTVSCI